MSRLTTRHLIERIEQLNRESNRLRGLYAARIARGNLRDCARRLLYPVVGHAQRLEHFYQAYRAYCGELDIPVPNRRAFSRELRLAGYMVGRGPGNVCFIGNVALEKMPPVGSPLTVKRGRLVH